MGKLAEAFVEIGTRTDAFDKGLTASEQKLKDFVGRAQSLTAALGVGLGAAGTVRLFADMAEKGSNLGETMNKVKEVFGASTSAVTGMADEMADKFGAVKGVTLDAAANLGLVAQGAGMTAQKAADLSIKLTRLADDAGSFFNVPLDVALEKIRSGLVGEAEPLRAFGVLLSEAAVKQQALAMGIKPVSGELSEQEKVLARVELITRGLAKAQGDHERTMGSYANQVKKLTGEWENLKAEMGAPLAGGASVLMENFRKEGFSRTLDKMFEGMWNMLEGKGENPFQGAADKAAGVAGAKGIGSHKTKAQVEEDILAARFREAIAANERKAFDANKFQGGGFGAFGPFGDMTGLVMPGINADIAKRQKDMRRNEWSGGWGAMGATDFIGSAQESILKPKDETAKKQLDELVKIREAVSKTKPPEVAGVVLRGRAN